MLKANRSELSLSSFGKKRAKKIKREREREREKLNDTLKNACEVIINDKSVEVSIP